MHADHENTFRCRDARRLMAFMSDNDPDLSREERENFERHLQVCPACAVEYEEDRPLAIMLKQYWAVKQAQESRHARGEPYRPMTIEESWNDLKRRWPPLAEACRRDERTKRKRLRGVIWRIGSMAAAACILIAIGVWFMMRKGNSSQHQPNIAANAGSPAMLGQLVTPEGRKPLATNQQITSGAQPREIWLGGMHRVVMNRNTKATFTLEPKRTEGPYTGKIPYQIQLAQGELYVEVVPGNPFTVKTANARLDITGTEFDVSTDGEKTDLTLLKGSIRFSALDDPQEFVSVTAGHTSAVAGRLAPTVPSPTDAVAAVAWARDEMLRRAMVNRQDKEVNADLLAMSATNQGLWQCSFSSDLDKLDYEKWRDDRRWNHLAVAALASLPKDKAVNADWIEVLMISGDIWQFHFDPNLSSGQPLTKLEPQAIIRLARHYGVDEKDISGALGPLKATVTATTSVQDGTRGRHYAEALRRWHDSILAAADVPNIPIAANSSLKTFSVNASVYLHETRIAAYLWVKRHPEEAARLLADKEYLAMLPTPPAMARDGEPSMNVWLRQLYREATAARNCFPAALQWLTAPPDGECQAVEPQHWLAELIAELTPSDRREGEE